MLNRKPVIAAAGAALAAAVIAFAPAAQAGNVGFSVSIGGPGYGVTVGNGPYYGGRYGYAPHYRGRYFAPAPVYYAPPVVYRPPVYAAPVYAAPVYAPAPVYYAPYTYYGRGPAYRRY